MNQPKPVFFTYAGLPQMSPESAAPAKAASPAPLVEYVKSLSPAYLFTLRSTKSVNAWGNRTTLLTVSSGYMFNCCGARTACGMDGVFNVEDKDQHRQKAEFLQQYLNNIGGDRYTLYCIATSTQMKVYRNNPRSVLYLLFEMGAEVVFKSPNYVHGPNDLHIIVWQPKIRTKLLNKYVAYNNRTWRWEVVPEPKQGEMFPETIKATVGVPNAAAQLVSKSPAGDSSKPLRDALGRFTRKVIV